MFVIPYQLKINIQYNGTIFVCSYFRVLRLGILFSSPLNCHSEIDFILQL